jgi:hypothetical protein
MAPRVAPAMRVLPLALAAALFFGVVGEFRKIHHPRNVEV